MKICPLGTELFRADGRTDKHEKANSHFSQFSNAPNKRKPKWIADILRNNCILQHVTERKIQGKGRRGRRSAQLLDDLEEKRRCFTLKEKTLDGVQWKIRFGTHYAILARQTN